MLNETHFATIDLVILSLSLVFVAASFILFQKNKYTASIVMLTAAAFAARLFVADLDHFLIVWDESIHALVARNMMTHPFTPMFYANPVLPTREDVYIASGIWLHKPPLFLWLMAISLKVFGINELGVRMPSVILSALITPMIYRIGKLTVSEKTGYYSALLFALSSYMLEVASGHIASDHNDASFIFFIAASFWAWFEYSHSGNKKWIYIIGLFSGMAVLVKWLTGLFIYFPWMLTILFSKEKRKSIQSYYTIFTSFLIAAIVFVPWQIYILAKFTSEALYAFSTYSDHFSTIMEGHDGTPYYHIDLIGAQYGWIVPFILALSFYLLYKKLHGNSSAKTTLISWVLITYIVFAIAKTKMPLMTLICCPVIFLSLGNLLSEIAIFIETKLKKTIARFVMATMLIIVVFFNISIDGIETEHTDKDADKKDAFLQNTFVAGRFKEIATQFPKKDYVVFNCCCFLPMSFMFYTGMTAYEIIPDKDLVIKLKKQGVKMAIFDNGYLADYIAKDPEIIKITLGQRPK